jgi:hypothetical protein
VPLPRRGLRPLGVYVLAASPGGRAVYQYVPATSPSGRAVGSTQPKWAAAEFLGHESV